MIRVVTRGHDDAAQRTAARAIERELRVAGIEVSGMYRMLDMKRSILDHLVIIMTLLTAASLIVVIVGALGLMSTMTVNVVQRTREIGILGAIGATPATIAFHIWIESLAVALASAVLAVLLAIPISAGIGATVGGIFFKAPLELSLSGRGIALWFLVVVVVASLASIYPRLVPRVFPSGRPSPMRNRGLVISLVVIVLVIGLAVVFGDRIEHWLLRLHGVHS